MEEKQKLIIMGSGELASQVMDYAESTNKFDVVGFIDNNHQIGEMIMGKPILGNDDLIFDLYNKAVFDCAFIALGYEKFAVKEKIYNNIVGKIPLATIISPSAIIHPNSFISEGVLIAEGAIIMKNVVVKENSYIGTGSMVGHDSIIHRTSFIAGRVAIAGFVSIGERCFIGVNSAIADNVKIHDDVWVCIGSTVSKDLKNSGKYISPSLKLIQL